MAANPAPSGAEKPHAFKIVVGNGLASEARGAVPATAYIDSMCETPLIGELVLDRWNQARLAANLEPFIIIPSTTAVRGVGGIILPLGTVTVPFTVSTISEGIAETFRFQASCLVLGKTDRVPFGDSHVDLILSEVASREGPLAALLARRLAGVHVESYIPTASCVPTDAHELKLAGGLLDDEAEEFAAHALPMPQGSGGSGALGINPDNPRPYIEAHLRAGVNLVHSAAVIWQDPDAPLHPASSSSPSSSSSPPIRPPAETQPSGFVAADATLQERLAFMQNALPTQDGISPGERQRLVDLLVEFADLFTKFSAKGTPLHVVDIPLIAGAKPYRARMRPVSPRLFAAAKQEFDSLVDNGLFVPAPAGEFSPWAAPLHAVAKRGGGVRLTMDFSGERGLNAQTVPLPAVFTSVEEHLQQAAGFRLYSSLDFSKGFWQVGLTPEAQRRAAIISPFDGKVYYMTRLAMGLAQSPALFQKLVDDLFEALVVAGECQLYIDDALLKSGGDSHAAAVEHHLGLLRRFFTICRANQLTINLAKSVFMSPTTTYLGNIISKNARSIDPSRLAGLKSLGPISSLAEARAFAGLGVHFDRFVPQMQSILSPIHDFIAAAANTPPGKPKPRPSPECLRAQQLATDAILQAGPLAQPDPAKPFIVRCDGSMLGCGAVLLQPADNGELVIVGFTSHRWSPTQRRWSVTDWEGAGVILALSKWGNLIKHSKVFIENDHQDLGVDWRASASPRVQRWAQILEQYNVSFSWIAGATNNIADLLSRVNPSFSGVSTAFTAWLARPASSSSSSLPSFVDVSHALAVLPPPNETQCYLTTSVNDEPDAEAGDDPAEAAAIISSIISAQSGEPAAAERRAAVKAGFITSALRNGHLIDLIGEGDSPNIWVPKSALELQRQLLLQAHERAGHRGGEATFLRLVEAGVHWVGMRAAAEAHAQSCVSCQLARKSPSAKFEPGVLGDYLSQATAPNSLIVADFLGPLAEVPHQVAPGVTINVSFILVLVDHFSRMCFLHPCQAADSKNVLFHLQHHLSRFGWPAHLRCDGGSHFANRRVEAFCKSNNITLSISSPYHPQAQGVVERRNASIAHVLRITTACGHNWADDLHLCEWFLNTTATRAHGRQAGTTPFQAFFGMKPVDALAASLGSARPSFSSFYERHVLADELREAVAAATAVVTGAQQQRHDARHHHDNITVGDTVAIWLPPQPKLAAQRDVGIVTEVVGSRGVAFAVKPIDCSKASTDKQQARVHIYHIERLKLLGARLRDLDGAAARERALTLTKAGLGTVESVIGVIPIYTHGCKHRVGVKWRNVPEDVATANSLTWTTADSLTRNSVLRAYCEARNWSFDDLTKNSPNLSLANRQQAGAVLNKAAPEVISAKVSAPVVPPPPQLSPPLPPSDPGLVTGVSSSASMPQSSSTIVSQSSSPSAAGSGATLSATSSLPDDHPPPAARSARARSPSPSSAPPISSATDSDDDVKYFYVVERNGKPQRKPRLLPSSKWQEEQKALRELPGSQPHLAAQPVAPRRAPGQPAPRRSARLNTKPTII